VKKSRPGQTRWTTDVDVVDLVRALARQMPDETIASFLNRSGTHPGSSGWPIWSETRYAATPMRADLGARRLMRTRKISSIYQ
jgi:hypothetical protein